MIVPIIYFIGSILAYRKMRRAWINHQFKDDNPWEKVIVSFVVAIISWVGFIMACGLDPKAPSIKPPKWL